MSTPIRNLSFFFNEQLKQSMALSSFYAAATNNKQKQKMTIEELKTQGNDAFRKGDIAKAIECYTFALKCCSSESDDNNISSTTTSSTLLSNRAMAYLKSAESLISSANVDSANGSTTSNEQQQIKNAQNKLQHCIDDCTLALQQLDSSTTSSNTTKEEEESKLNLRSKLLYRNAKALVTLSSLPSSASSTTSNTSNSTSSNSNMSNSSKEKKLNEAAKLLLQLLQLQPTNKEASSLLNQIREIHTSMNGSGSGSGSSRVGKALDYLKTLMSDNNVKDKGEIELPKDEKGKEITILDCLHILQGSLSDDIPSTSSDIGNYNNGEGVQLLLQIARFGIPPPPPQEGEERDESSTQCRLASLHILSACCSTDTFILQYAHRNILSPNLLAQIVEEEASSLSSTSGSSNKGTREGAADITVATIALLVRLIVHYDHYEIIKHFTPKILEDGTIEELSDVQKKKLQQMQIPEVDGSVVCRVAIAAFLWGTNDDGSSSNKGENVVDTRPPRAALDLLSAWTASDLDALDAASDACFAPTGDSSNGQSLKKKKASQHFLSPEDIRRMKPRQVSTHRKREGEFTRSNLQRAIKHISTFCNDQSGGLNSMLICASTTIDHRLRREVGLQIGRMMSVYVENDDVKKLIYRELGCSDWTVGKDDEEKGNENVGQTELSTLTIEELDDEDEEGKEMDESNEESKLLTMMKRGQLTASLIMGKPDVGTWALKYAWSNGQGVEELKQLISSNNSCAMSIASELVSAASSVESSRPLLATLVQEGTLEDLLIHPDADVRSGAASCAAKIGLASKALSSDDGEVMGLLDVAIELLFEEDEWLDGDDDNKSSSKVEALTKKVPPSRKASGESTSMDRGIEVLAYLVSKTFVKEKVVGGYKPEGSPPDRKTALERLVEIACAPSSGDAQLSYGLASVFNLLAVSIETLRKEAFIGKEITREQYDQLQALGKTEEEKEAEAKKDEKEGDNPASVSERIRKLASCNVPRAMVKLLEGSSSDTTQDKLLEGMCRMASEPTVRGLMIQQGCLTTCLQLDKGDKPNETGKKIIRQARTCVAKLLVTTNPGILTVSQRSGAVGPLLKLIKDNDAMDLMHFEALMSLTNLIGFDNETKNRVVAQKGIPTLGYAMFSDHEMVRQAATEALCNMVGNPEFMEYLQKEDNLRVWIAFSLDYEANFVCARAAIGCLAMACVDPEIAKAIVKSEKFDELIRTLLECGQLEMMHRVLALILDLIEQGGECREAVLATGAGPFCDAILTAYPAEKLKEFDFSPAERASLGPTLGLAKEVVGLLK